MTSRGCPGQDRDVECALDQLCAQIRDLKSPRRRIHERRFNPQLNSASAAGCWRESVVLVVVVVVVAGWACSNESVFSLEGGRLEKRECAIPTRGIDNQDLGVNLVLRKGVSSRCMRVKLRCDCQSRSTGSEGSTRIGPRPTAGLKVRPSAGGRKGPSSGRDAMDTWRQRALGLGLRSGSMLGSE